MGEELLRTLLFYSKESTEKKDLDSLLVHYLVFHRRFTTDLMAYGLKWYADFIRSLNASLKKYLNRLYTLVLLKSRRNDTGVLVSLLLISISSTFVVMVVETDIGCMCVRYIVHGIKPSERELTFADTLIQCPSFLAGEASIVSEFKKVRQRILENT